MESIFRVNALEEFSPNRPAIIYCEKNVSKHVFTYKDLTESIKSVIRILEPCEKKYFIGVYLDLVPCIIPVILGILNTSTAFCCFSKHDDKQKLCQNLEILYFISNDSCTMQSGFENINQFKIFGTNLILWKFQNLNKSLSFFQNEDTKNMDNYFCYSIQTSGSTGIPKIVRVPHDCIFPNIIHLQIEFQILETDVIYLNSPPTFDPFIVDLFLAVISGASMLLVDSTLRLSSDKTADCLFNSKDFGVTIMQITPSLFKLWNLNDIQKKIMSPSSSLRTLILGGELFPPIKEVAKWQDWVNPTIKVYNIYGITEVSCWASLEEVNAINTEREPSLGFPLDEDTFIEVRYIQDEEVIIEIGTGILFVGSRSRVCLIDNEIEEYERGEEVIYRSSGDVVTRTKYGEVFFEYRIDDIIKRFGIRTNLKLIETTTTTLEFILEARCVFIDHLNKLVLFYILNERAESISKTDVTNALIPLLKDHEIPDDILEVLEFPISSHGKISKKKLIEFFLTRSPNSIKPKSLETVFFEKIEKLNQVKLIQNSELDEEQLNNSFISSGGTSIKALILIKTLEDHSNSTLPELITLLLNEEISFKTILNYLEKQTIKISSKNEQEMVIDKKIKSNIKLKIDLEKCIDASPTISDIKKHSVLSIGSHSGILLNINTITEQQISKLKLPDRIESQASICDDFGVVGCFDGFLYCFDINLGIIKWTFNSGGMIKCKPLICIETKRIYFGNYNKDQNFWCIDLYSGTLIGSLLIGTNSILSSACILQGTNYMVCTLDGTCCRLTDDLTIVWLIKLKSSVFSNPQVLPNETGILIAEVSGQINCIDFNGVIIWTFMAEGNIFTSFDILHIKESESEENLENLEFTEEILIYFGSFDKKIYCLEYKIETKNVTVKWKTELESQIYATPKIFCDSYIVCCTTTGIIYLLKHDTGLIVNHNYLNGEIFSTPAIKDSWVFLGCRDNYLYCIEYHLPHLQVPENLGNLL